MPRPVWRRFAAHRSLRWIAGIAVGVLSALVAHRTDGDLAVVAGCILVVLVSAPIIWRIRRNPLDPPAIYATVSAGCYGVMSLSWTGDPPSIPAPGIGQADIAQSLALVAVGMLAFGVAAALVAGPARRRPPLVGGESERVPVALLLGLFALGVIAVPVGLMFGAIGFNSDAGQSTGAVAYAQVFQQLSLLGGLIVGAFSLWVFRRDERPLRWLLLTLVVVQTLIGFASGYKQQALLPVLIVGVAYVSCSGRVPWKALGVAAAVAGLILLPATIYYRGVLRPTPGAVDVGTPAGLVSESANYLNARFRLADSVALIESRTPEVYPRGNGRRYTLLPALITVPRAVWADKPILNDGLEFSHTYWEVPPSITTATPLTQPGDLLRNFGWSGVIVGMALWGALIGLLTRVNSQRRSPRLELVCLVALVQIVPFVDSDLPQLLAGASRTLLLAAVVGWLALPGPTQPPGFTRLLDVARRLKRPPARAAWIDDRVTRS